MKKFAALSLVAFASLGLSACSEKANESVEVTNEVDANMTAEETIADINATTENVVDTANATLENAGAAAEHAVDNAHNAM